LGSKLPGAICHASLVFYERSAYFLLSAPLQYFNCGEEGLLQRVC